jgi:hypothetical protein
MATARRCSGCGATLNDAPDNASTITCRFCGLTHDLPGSATGARPVVVEIGPVVRQTGKAIRTIVLAILAVVALVTAAGLYVAYRAMDTAREVVTRATGTAPPTTPAKARSLAPADLATSLEGGWQPLEVAPPPGGYEAFEPVAALPWALDIARGWASDAALTRIDVGRVDASGVVSQAGETRNGYRFTSAGRQARWKQEADSGASGRARTGLMLWVQPGKVQALLEEGRAGDDAPPPPSVSLPLADLLERARKGRGFQDRPYYSAYMIHLPREGWVWYFSSPSGDSFPRVRARDGRPYPY